MKYEKINETSFKLIKSDSSIEGPFTFPEHFTLWQQGKLAPIVAKALRSDFIKVLIAGFTSAPVADGKADYATGVLGKLKDLSKATSVEELFASGAEGIAELIELLSEDDMLARAAAILYLKEGENKLSKEELVRRTELFLELPLSALIGGVIGFFGSKLSLPMSIISLSQTSAIQISPMPQSV